MRIFAFELQHLAQLHLLNYSAFECVSVCHLSVPAISYFFFSPSLLTLGWIGGFLSRFLPSSNLDKYHILHFHSLTVYPGNDSCIINSSKFQRLWHLSSPSSEDQKGLRAPARRPSARPGGSCSAASALAVLAPRTRPRPGRPPPASGAAAGMALEAALLELNLSLGTCECYYVPSFRPDIFTGYLVFERTFPWA